MAEKPGAVPSRANFPCSRSPRHLSSSATAPPPSTFRARKGGRVVRTRAGNETAGKETAGKGADVAARGRGSDVTATGGEKDRQVAEGGQDVIIEGQVVRVTQEDIDIAEMIEALESAFEELEEERYEEAEKGKGKGKAEGEREGQAERKGKQDGKGDVKGEGEGEDGGRTEGAKQEGKEGKGKREEGRVEGDEDSDTEAMEYDMDMDLDIDLGELCRSAVVRWLVSWNLSATWQGDVQTLAALLDELYTNEMLVMTQEKANDAMAAAVRAGTDFFRANLEKQYVWYDADGKVVTDWTNERVSVYVAGTLSLFLDISLEGNSDTAFPPAALNWLDERNLRSEVFGPGAAVDIVTCVPGPYGGKVFAFELPEGREAGEVYAALNSRLRRSFPNLEVSLDSMQYAMDVGDDMFKGGGGGMGGENDRDGGWGGGPGGGGDGGGGGGNWNEWGQFQTGNAPTLYTTCAAFVVRRDVFLQPGLPLPITAGAAAFTLASLKSLVQPDLALTSSADLAWALLGFYAGVAATTGAAMAGQYVWAWSYRTDTAKPPSPLYFLPLFAPDIGLVTLITQVVAPVPSRVALLDLTLLSSSAAIFSSFALLQASAASSVETLVIHPLALAGLLGLHVSAVSLLPAVGLPGGDILYALVRDPLVLSLATTAVTIMLLVSIPLNFSWTWVLLFLLLPLLALAKIRRPVSEALTAPDPVRVCLGVGLLVTGVVVLLPAPLFELVFGEPAGPVAEQILISLGLG
ncbi:unnamed protein product [Closterium sp. Naga37s-1]|nr:unnamed protein product [Closterium sp. Naga37s-1]